MENDQPVLKEPQPITQPQPQPTNPTLQQQTTKETSTSAGLIVLQWLTYAFWGWTLLALSALSSIVIYSLIDDADTSGMLPYALAAVFVLLPISVVCDIFYSKKETQKKRGASMVVMIIHAVIFALFAIGSLIGAVFSIVQLTLATDDSSNSMSTLISLLIIALLYSLTFIRTLNPFPKLKITKIYIITMLLITTIFLVLGMIGPFAKSLQTKDDRRIETYISGVKNGVDSYISENSKLPEQISDVEIESLDAKKLVDEGLVVYKKGDITYDDGYYSDDNKPSPVYRYKLCAYYKGKKNESYSSYSDASYDDEYQEYLDVYDHPKGEVCYKLQKSKYSY